MPRRVTSAETTSRRVTVPSALSSLCFKAESSRWQFTPFLFFTLSLYPLLGSWSSPTLWGPSTSKHEWVQSKLVPSPPHSTPHKHPCSLTHTCVWAFFFPLSFLFPSDAQVPSPLHDWSSLTSGNHRYPTSKRWRVKKTSEACTLQLWVSWTHRNEDTRNHFFTLFYITRERTCSQKCGGVYSSIWKVVDRKKIIMMINFYFAEGDLGLCPVVMTALIFFLFPLSVNSTSFPYFDWVSHFGDVPGSQTCLSAEADPSAGFCLKQWVLGGEK